MTDKHPTAFISYSWDSEEHQQWVIDLANKLRENGIDADLDIFNTQERTINLNQMMVSGFRDNDYIIIVLTEGYARRAERSEGGVGFETQLSYEILRNNKDKLVFITRGALGTAFPFHLKGYYAIDFTDDASFEVKLDELLRRIYNKPFHQKAPLGPIPDFNNAQTEQSAIFAGLNELDMPDLREITDRDKIKFIRSSYQEINSKLKKLLEKLKAKNSNVDYDFEEITTRKSIFKIFKNGSYVTEVKIWLDNSLGGPVENICLYYGRSFAGDNAMNEQIRCEVSPENKLELKATINMYLFNRQEYLTTDQIVKNIWEQQISSYLKR